MGAGLGWAGAKGLGTGGIGCGAGGQPGVPILRRPASTIMLHCNADGSRCANLILRKKQKCPHACDMQLRLGQSQPPPQHCGRNLHQRPVLLSKP